MLITKNPVQQQFEDKMSHLLIVCLHSLIRSVVWFAPKIGFIWQFIKCLLWYWTALQRGQYSLKLDSVRVAKKKWNSLI